MGSVDNQTSQTNKLSEIDTIFFLKVLEFNSIINIYSRTLMAQTCLGP